MKFSISFKYSNVTFRNRETKETVAYDTKADGNTFTFDNVDEDVVIGIVKGIKDRKASQVFAFDNLRTNFVNVIARNKCKELYDRLDKGGWKVEDVAISTATIKDLEFTKPTMNARENLTVESRKPHKGNTIFIDWHWSSEYDVGESGTERIEVDDISKESIRRKVQEFCSGEWPEVGPNCDNVYVEVFADLIPDSKPVFLFDGSFSYGEMKWYEDDGREHRCREGIYGESNFKGNMRLKQYDDLYELNNVVHEAIKEIDIINNSIQDEKLHDRLFDVRMKLLNALPSTKAKKMVREANKEQVKVKFKKTPEDGEVIAFFPDTMKDGSCNPGMIMSYMHVGQHSEASVEFYNDCTTCLEEDYADLLVELERVYNDCELVVVD